MSDTTATTVEKVNYYEDFEVGQEFEHHWGRTINAGDNSLFTTLRINANPTYFNADYAEKLGYDDVVVDALLVFNVVNGMSVQDLSEAGGAFLGIEDLRFQRPVYTGETLYANSEVLSKRESDSRPNQGIVTWKTVGQLPDETQVIEYERTNLVDKRNPPEG